MQHVPWQVVRSIGQSLSNCSSTFCIAWICFTFGLSCHLFAAVDQNNEQYYRTHPNSPYESFSQLPPDEPDKTYNDSNSYGPNYYYQPQSPQKDN